MYKIKIGPYMRALEQWQCFLNIATVTLTLALERSNSYLSKIVSYLTFVWYKIKISLKIKALEWWQSFPKNSHCDLELDPIMLKRKLIWGIVIPNTFVKFMEIG